MSLEIFDSVVSVTGLALAFVGVPALFVQLREVRRSLAGQVHAAMYTQAAEFRAHLVAHPDLRKYFFAGAEIGPDHPDYDRVVTIAEIFLNYLEHIAVMGDSFGERNIPALQRFCRSAMDASPVMRQRLIENRVGYSDALGALVLGPGKRHSLRCCRGTDFTSFLGITPPLRAWAQRARIVNPIANWRTFAEVFDM